MSEEAMTADQSDAGHGISSEELRRIDPINPGFIDALEEVNRRESDAGRDGVIEENVAWLERYQKLVDGWMQAAINEQRNATIERIDELNKRRALASAPSETVGRVEGDFTVADSILAGAILTQLGFAGQASGSLEPGIDHRRDRIAKMIFAERHRVALFTTDRDAIRAEAIKAIKYASDISEYADSRWVSVRADLIAKHITAALALIGEG